MGFAFRIMYEALDASDTASDRLAQLMSYIAETHNGTDVDGVLKSEQSSPGYLARTIDSRKIFVPFNLAYVSPSQSHIPVLMAIASEISMVAGGEMCLSGSATFLGRSQALQDIDFAEYFCSAPNAAALHVGTMDGRVRPKLTRLISLTVKYPKVSGKRNASYSSPVAAAVDAVDVGDWREIFVKGNSPFLNNGRMKISCKIFPVGPGDTSPDSYVLQEIVFSDPGSGQAPRSLAERKRVRKYVSWLLSEAGKLLDDRRHMKALKRSISLALLLGFDKLFNAGLELLPSDSSKIENPQAIETFVKLVMKEAEDVAGLAGAAHRERVN